MYPNPSRRDFLRRTALSVPFLHTTGTVLVALSAEAEEGSEAGPKEKSVYEPGGDVKPPKLIHYVEPSFSPSGKEAYVEGVVRISTVVTTEGVPTELKLVSGLNAEEDRTAMEALKQWKFEPGTKAGEPVNVRVTVEVEFHLL